MFKVIGNNFIKKTKTSQLRLLTTLQKLKIHTNHYNVKCPVIRLIWNLGVRYSDSHFNKQKILKAKSGQKIPIFIERKGSEV